MDCKEYEKKIPLFIDDEMNFTQLKEFARHTSTCESCKEELTIQFLIDKGLERLEEGSAFDLNKEMQLRMEAAKGKIQFHERFLKIGFFWELLAVAAVVAIVVWILY
ncbi:MAG: zf-HC2 domain-containing protein [Lachnospiraceae bacterium]|nr:zf-HC2 domain-containing protein [Lachnospiraceae bacterium]